MKIYITIIILSFITLLPLIIPLVDTQFVVLEAYIELRPFDFPFHLCYFGTSHNTPLGHSLSMALLCQSPCW
jgi:hypothetical protein